MGKKAVEATFEALFALTELRGIFRETTPRHGLSKEQVKKVNTIRKIVRKDIDLIEEDLLP